MNKDLKKLLVRSKLINHNKLINHRQYDLIKKHKTIFMAVAWDIGCTTLMKHKIVTEGGPVLIKPRMQPMNLESKLMKQLLICGTIIL